MGNIRISYTHINTCVSMYVYESFVDAGYSTYLVRTRYNYLLYYFNDMIVICGM